MTKTKFETNEQFVSRIMTTGSPLRQAFVIEAICKYSDACAAQPASTFDSPMLHGASWVEVAKELKKECDEKYGPRATHGPTPNEAS